MNYYIHLAILFCIYLVLAQSFNITFGWGRMLNLAHVSLFGLGAYVTALLSTQLEVPFWLCAAQSAALAACFALLIGAVSLRLTEDAFAIGTLAFSALVTAVLVNWKSVTNGSLGIAAIPRPEIAATSFQNNADFLTLSFTVAVISAFSIALLSKSRLARQLRALAEDDPVARSLGINGKVVRNIAFALSSMYAALAGSLYAAYLSYVEPTMFGLHEMVTVLSILVIGGPGSVRGVTIATAVVLYIPEALRFLQMPASILGPTRQLLTALLLIGFVYMRRSALMPPKREV